MEQVDPFTICVTCQRRVTVQLSSSNAGLPPKLERSQSVNQYAGRQDKVSERDDIILSHKIPKCVSHNLSFVTIWVFKYCHHLSYRVLPVFEFHHHLSSWVWLEFEFLSFIKKFVFEFCHNLRFWVSSQFEFYYILSSLSLFLVKKIFFFCK